MAHGPSSRVSEIGETIMALDLTLLDEAQAPKGAITKNATKEQKEMDALFEALVKAGAGKVGRLSASTAEPAEGEINHESTRAYKTRLFQAASRYNHVAGNTTKYVLTSWDNTDGAGEGRTFVYFKVEATSEASEATGMQPPRERKPKDTMPAVEAPKQPAAAGAR